MMRKYLRASILLSISLFVLAGEQVARSDPQSTVHKHTKGAPITSSVNLARREGAALFRANGCFDCHSIDGRGSTEGVSLSSVGLRRDREFLAQQLQDPEEHVRKNKKAFNSEPNLMTNPNLSRQEINQIVTYLQSLKKPVPKKGQQSKWYNSL
jgi:mono/diheme cytochrome c family protein